MARSRSSRGLAGSPRFTVGSRLREPPKTQAPPAEKFGPNTGVFKNAPEAAIEGGPTDPLATPPEDQRGGILGAVYTGVFQGIQPLTSPQRGRRQQSQKEFREENIRQGGLTGRNVDLSRGAPSEREFTPDFGGEIQGLAKTYVGSVVGGAVGGAVGAAAGAIGSAVGEAVGKVAGKVGGTAAKLARAASKVARGGLEGAPTVGAATKAVQFGVEGGGVTAPTVRGATTPSAVSSPSGVTPGAKAPTGGTPVTPTRTQVPRRGGSDALLRGISEGAPGGGTGKLAAGERFGASDTPGKLFAGKRFGASDTTPFNRSGTAAARQTLQNLGERTVDTVLDRTVGRAGIDRGVIDKLSKGEFGEGFKQAGKNVLSDQTGISPETFDKFKSGDIKGGLRDTAVDTLTKQINERGDKGDEKSFGLPPLKLGGSLRPTPKPKLGGSTQGRLGAPGNPRFNRRRR